MVAPIAFSSTDYLLCRTSNLSLPPLSEGKRQASAVVVLEEVAGQEAGSLEARPRGEGRFPGPPAGGEWGPL